MPESTLSLGCPDYKVIIADFVGFGLGPVYDQPEWNTQQQYHLKELLAEAQRIVYHPEPEMDGAPTYDWSFLHPTATLTLLSGDTELTLPDDFGGVEGPLTLLGSSTIPTIIQFVSEPFIRQLFTVLPNATGQPQYVAMAPIKGTTFAHGQKQKMVVYPGADADYTIQFQYYLLPDAITNERPFAYGGSQHTSLFRAACLKVAESFLDDTPRSEGKHALEFKARLAASVGWDRKMKPQSGGSNIDRSDNRNVVNWDRSGLYNQTATFDGVAYLWPLLVGLSAAMWQGVQSGMT